MFLLWLRIAAGLYGVASILAIPAVLGNRPRGHRYCLPVAMGGWFFHLVATVEMLGSRGDLEIFACTLSVQVLAKVVAHNVVV